MEAEASNPLIFALDISPGELSRWLGLLKDWVWGFKVGKELFTEGGPQVVEKIREEGGRVFLDLKYHDIPNTVAGAARAATRLEVEMFDLHALGGQEMMRRAVEACREEAERLGVVPPKVLAVTILTSLRDRDLEEIGIGGRVRDTVARLALLARKAGVDGVVASPQEIEVIRAECGEGFLIVTPGVRPKGMARHDQSRILTPGEAVKAGADFLVVGRPIREAEDPVWMAQAILAEVREARVRSS